MTGKRSTENNNGNYYKGHATYIRTSFHTRSYEKLIVMASIVKISNNLLLVG